METVLPHDRHDSATSDQNGTVDTAVAEHDRRVCAVSPPIWIGAEPTFTDRFSESPEWLTEAVGAAKEHRARQMLALLADRSPHAVVLRTVGRQYPGEPHPRWSYGLYARRDGQPVWKGPPDPLMDPRPARVSTDTAERFWETLTEMISECWPALKFMAPGSPGWRVLFRCDGNAPAISPDSEAELARKPVAGCPTPRAGLNDTLAERGEYLLQIDVFEDASGTVLAVDLPDLSDTERFLTLMYLLGEAAGRSGLSHLVVCGFPPPVDQSVAWTTLTPDPAVLEVNQAPCVDTSHFLRASRALYNIADTIGLSPYRLQYNGSLADSGGGGQFTVGGPTPENSPFFLAPSLLPALIAYVNNHPALSYWFAAEYVGSSSQAPRPDEGVRESFLELAVAIEQLNRKEHPDAGFLWESLSPFLSDPTGNGHRSELNIEKLWNQQLARRGKLGLVEFRAFRMSDAPARAAALAALLRGIIAMLFRAPCAAPLINWGDSLHDRFALPHFLGQDLEAVLSDLEEAGVGLPHPLPELLTDEGTRLLGETRFSGVTLRLHRALEFWPLIGDASVQDGGSRWVDASTTRLQVSLIANSDRVPPLEGWILAVDGTRIPLHRDEGPRCVVHLSALRYRTFKPYAGLHPGIDAQGPVRLSLRHPDHAEALKVTLHEWRPDGCAYPGLPTDLETAAARCRERFVTEIVPSHTLPPWTDPDPDAVSGFCLDLRRLGRGGD